MARFQNFIIEKIKILAKARSINGYENICKQQLESIFTKPSIPKLTLKQFSKHLNSL